MVQFQKITEVQFSLTSRSLRRYHGSLVGLQSCLSDLIADNISSLLERASFICLKECLLDSYPKGLATLSIPLLYSLLEEIYPTLSSDPNHVFNFTEEELEGIESKLFWMLYILCEDHKVKSVLENPLLVTSAAEEILLASNSRLHTHLKSNNVNFTHPHRWQASFLLPLFRQLPLFMLLWDKYMTNVHRFSAFHGCVCASIILYNADHLQTLSGSELHKALSHPAQNSWTFTEMTDFLKLVDTNSEYLTSTY